MSAFCVGVNGGVKHGILCVLAVIRRDFRFKGCGEIDVLVFMCKGMFVEERVTVGGKVAWRSGMRSMELVVVLGV